MQNVQRRTTVFRTFSEAQFLETPAWNRLATILTGNGGCYGLHGPRGSGKSWLMMRSIHLANASGGLGLWFPTPSEYQATAFLSSLSDNLANAVERRTIGKPWTAFARKASQSLMLLGIGFAFLLTAPSIVQTVFAGNVGAGAISTSYLVVIAYVEIIAISLRLALVVREQSPTGRLLREATALRERIRYTASLKYGSEFGLNTTGGIIGNLKRSRESALSERPTTISSLIFDFRNLAERIVEVLPGKVVIGIDELDKMESAEAVQALLRDVKGIFEVTGVHFLVSVSQEAATALRLGSISGGGRSEFNSSFYTVIELPALTPDEALELLTSRGMSVDETVGRTLCVLAEGNQRELMRMAEICEQGAGVAVSTVDEIVLPILGDERATLLREIVSMDPEGDNALAANAKEKVWRSLPGDWSKAKSSMAAARQAMTDLWDPEWSNDVWKRHVNAGWRRLLIRRVVGAALIEDPSLLADRLSIIRLRDILIMASLDAGVARRLLGEQFGDERDSQTYW